MKSPGTALEAVIGVGLVLIHLTDSGEPSDQNLEKIKLNIKMHHVVLHLLTLNVSPGTRIWFIESR